ncbi:hypothetical protein [Corynebacterium sp. sy039]|uniref:hypothetical protein n=1 Tax=Corynebacterium sp. sy039 TaxID=2599641 RepID=UPI0011B79851|nr:hypothetical protein [Corynebacterium sp. sy039]QDZ42435.1 hypothetical protein FQV43_04115 [Corynebacterium sp. sy039]
MRELAKFKGKRSVFVPIAITLLFCFWSSAVIFLNTDASQGELARDPRGVIVTLVQLGGVFIPLMALTLSLMIANIDQNSRMIQRQLANGVSRISLIVHKVAFILCLLLLLFAIVLLVSLGVATQCGVNLDPRMVLVASSGFICEIVFLTLLFSVLSLYSSRHTMLIIFGIGGAIAGAASLQIPKVVAAFIPFFFAGATAPAKVVMQEEMAYTDTPISFFDIGIPLILTGIILLLTYVFIRRRALDV